MLNIVAYIHPIRTYLPCTGAGRFINNILLGISNQETVELELLFSRQWLGRDGKLASNCPLRNLPIHTFPMAENRIERLWKLLGFPHVDRYLPEKLDWLFAPMETYIPVSKCPVVVTLYDIQAFETNLPWSHTWQHRQFRYKWGRWIRRALAESRMIFTISEFTKQRMVNLLGAEPDKIIVVGCGVEQTFFDAGMIKPDEIALPIRRPYTLVIGGLREKKGADYVLASAKALLQRKSDLQIVVAGESEPNYINTVKDYSNITLLGVISDEILPKLLRNASSLLFLSHYEGFGIPAVEAMAVGIPVIVSNRGSLPEIVGNAGIIVEPTSTEEIVDILINLEKDARLSEKYSQISKVHAAQYQWSHCVERAVNAFKQFA